MKIAPLFFGFLALLVTTPSYAAVQPSPNCAAANEHSLVVAKMMDDPVQVGYAFYDEFFAMQVTGCAALRLEGNRLLCDGAVVGSVGEFSEYGGDLGYSTLAAPLTVGAGMNVMISGACLKKSDKLTLEIQK